MKKEYIVTVLQRIEEVGIVPVVKINDAKNAISACRALRDGGIPIAEITFRTDAAEESIKAASGGLDDVLVGAGTVLSVDQAKCAIDAGARFLVTPGFNDSVVGYCVKPEVPVIPGCSCPSDIERALGYGIKTVKLFPADLIGGVAAVKAFSGPYAGVRFVPTGGVNIDNMLSYLALKQVAAIGGSWMISAAAIDSGDFESIRELAAQAVTKLLGFSIRHIGIDAQNPDEAAQYAGVFTDMFSWPTNEGNSSIFSGTGIEVNKAKGKGEKGHIAIATNDLTRAKAHLERKGYSFSENSIKLRPDGKPAIIYFEKEVGGFALHLFQL